MKARVLLVAGLLASPWVLSGCVPPGIACPAVEYVDLSPIVGRFVADGSELAELRVEACFGRDCVPIGVSGSRVDGYEVPQEPPYLPRGMVSIDAAEGIRVVVRTASGEVLADDWQPVPVVSEPGIGFCPGPFEYGVVEVAQG
jgi:hypothetical protein